MTKSIKQYWLWENTSESLVRIFDSNRLIDVLTHEEHQAYIIAASRGFETRYSEHYDSIVGVDDDDLPTDAECAEAWSRLSKRERSRHSLLLRDAGRRSLIEDRRAPLHKRAEKLRLEPAHLSQDGGLKRDEWVDGVRVFTIFTEHCVMRSTDATEFEAWIRSLSSKDEDLETVLESNLHPHRSVAGEAIWSTLMLNDYDRERADALASHVARVAHERTQTMDELIAEFAADPEKRPGVEVLEVAA